MQQPAVMLDVVEEEFEHFEPSIRHFLGEEVWRQLSQPYPNFNEHTCQLFECFFR